MSSKTATASAAGGANGTPDSTDTTGGISLGAALEQLLYFNGRFLKAEDLKLEQTGYMTRIALSERAQGAGVSYGFHVTTATKATPDNFVKSVADAVFAKMQANRTEWVDFLDDADEGTPPPGDAALVDRLASALDALCGAPSSPSGVVLTIAPGHAADGYGHDLLLASSQQVKLAKLIDGFTAAPTFTDAPGPVVTPKPMTSAPALTGAFLLTLHANHHDHGNVAVYGAQCTDAKTAACSLGYRATGVSAQLVFFSALDGAVPASDWWAWRGMGARAYFEQETATRPSLLPNMVATLPFSAAAKAPETGTHVPIGVVYLQNGNFVTFDPWTAKRLRSPGELTYWLRTLLYPPQVSQLAHVLQFESQLTDALAAGAASGSTKLWDLGFADGSELVLPGVGFLPVQIATGGEALPIMTVAALTPTLDAYFDGVPYKVIEATEGEMNAVFVGALESGELRLTRTAPPADNVPDRCEDVIAAINTTVDTWLATPTSRPAEDVIGDVNEMVDGFLADAPGTPTGTPTGPAQVFVWFTPNPFPGYVMFTWPAPLPTATASPLAAQPRVCTQARLMPARDDGPQFEVLGHDGEWAAYLVAGMGSFYSLRGIRLELEAPIAGLDLHYALISQSGAQILPDAGGWLMLPTPGSPTGGGGGGDEIAGLRIWLTGALAPQYSVLYRIRFRLGNAFYVDTPTFANGQLLTGDASTWTNIPGPLFDAVLASAFQALEPDASPPGDTVAESIWVSIVPRCPSEQTAIAIPIGELDRRNLRPAGAAPGRFRMRWTR